MKPTISIPREALVQLLQASGSPLTPEQYVASLPEVSEFKKYPSRARAAAMSKAILLLVTIFAVVFVFFFPGIENGIILVGLALVTFFEYRVHRYFREENPKAPGLGFRNQSAFAAGILIYCLYQGFSTFQMPLQAQTLVEENNLIDPDMLTTVARLFYLFIAVTAGGSQFGLAWYYRNAQVEPTS